MRLLLPEAISQLTRTEDSMVGTGSSQGQCLRDEWRKLPPQHPWPLFLSWLHSVPSWVTDEDVMWSLPRSLPSFLEEAAGTAGKYHHGHTGRFTFHQGRVMLILKLEGFVEISPLKMAHLQKRLIQEVAAHQGEGITRTNRWKVLDGWGSVTDSELIGRDVKESDRWKLKSTLLQQHGQEGLA